MTTRKDALAGAAAASLASLWGCSNPLTSALLSQSLSPELSRVDDAKTNYDVIVVGAGAAGIAAARAVLSGRRSVLVLEAQDHIGGRCRSLNAFPIPYDQGAQFVSQANSVNNFLYPLMVQRGIKLIAGDAVERYFYDPLTGDHANSRDLEKTYASVDAALLEAGQEMSLGARDRSARAVIKANELADAPYLKAVEDFIITAVDGGDPKDQSTLDLFNTLNFFVAPFAFPPRDIFFVPSGYGNFLASLAKGLPIRTNSPVTAIDYGGSLVSVKTARQTYTAKAAIVTVSVNVLKHVIDSAPRLAFTPHLPAAYTNALAGITMGHCWKGMLEFKGKPFDSFVPPGRTAELFPLANENIPQFFVNLFAEAFRNLPHTYVMAIGEGQLGLDFEALGPQKAGAKVCDILETPIPGITAAWTGNILTSNWATNPYTQGCLTYATVGSAGARTTLALPIKNKLFFAGEAVSVHGHSQVNGAWETGTDAGYGALFAIGALNKRQLMQLQRSHPEVSRR